MSPFEIALLTCILFAILAGVGSGVHLAYRLAEGQSRGPSKKNRYVDNTEPQPKEKKTWIKRPWADKNKESPQKDTQHLSSKIHNQSGESFAEFDCGFTGEDPEVKLEEARGKQDESYQFLSD